MPRRYRFHFTALAALCVLTGCGDALIYGERTRFNLAIGVNDSAALPITVNVGLQRLVVNYAPPIQGTSVVNNATLPHGEAVDSISNFNLTDSQAASNPLGGELEITTQFAAGAAATSLSPHPGPAAVMFKTPTPAPSAAQTVAPVVPAPAR